MVSLVGVRHRQVARTGALAFAVVAASSIALAPLRAQEKVDVATIEKIKAEETMHSHVMEIMSWLSDVYGPRLTWSPNVTRAKIWTLGQMKEWGLSNVHEEKWGPPFGIGWENERFSFNALTPVPFIIEAVPQAWSVGTIAPVTGSAVLLEGVACLDELKARIHWQVAQRFHSRHAATLGCGQQLQPVRDALQRFGIGCDCQSGARCRRRGDLLHRSGRGCSRRLGGLPGAGGAHRCCKRGGRA